VLKIGSRLNRAEFSMFFGPKIFLGAGPQIFGPDYKIEHDFRPCGQI